MVRGRRGNREGTVRWRPWDRRWEALLTLLRGRRRSFFVRPSPPWVQDKLLKARFDLARGLEPPDGRLMVARYGGSGLRANVAACGPRPGMATGAASSFIWCRCWAR